MGILYAVSHYSSAETNLCLITAELCYFASRLALREADEYHRQHKGPGAFSHWEALFLGCRFVEAISISLATIFLPWFNDGLGFVASILPVVTVVATVVWLKQRYHGEDLDEPVCNS